MLNYIYPAGHKTRPLDGFVPHGTPPGDITANPNFFAAVSRQLVPLDLVRLIWEDESAEALVRVLEVAPPRVRVRVVHLWTEEAIPEKRMKSGGLAVVWRDDDRWCVILESAPHEQPVAKGFATKQLAIEKMNAMVGKADKATG